MEHSLQVDAHRAVVRVGLHDVRHEVPPFAVDGGVRPFGPQLLVLDLYVAKEGQGLPVQKNGIVLPAVLMDHVLHLGPQFIVPLLILSLLAGIQLHFESFDHCFVLLFYDFPESPNPILSRFWLCSLILCAHKSFASKFLYGQKARRPIKRDCLFRVIREQFHLIHRFIFLHNSL